MLNLLTEKYQVQLKNGKVLCVCLWGLHFFHPCLEWIALISMFLLVQKYFSKIALKTILTIFKTTISFNDVYLW